MSMRARTFDYSRVDWRFVARIMRENNLRLSRTRAGVSDTMTNPKKLPLLLSGDELRRRSALNEQRVCRFIFQTRLDPPPQSGAAVQELLFTIADLTNDGLLPAGRLRLWSSSARHNFFNPTVFKEISRVAPEKLPAALRSFSQEVCRRWPELEIDPVLLYAWCEWELNFGPLHPFYDGCGRISRSFGAMLLIRASYPLPRFDSPSAYFEHGDQGPETFAEHVRERIGG